MPANGQADSTADLWGPIVVVGAIALTAAGAAGMLSRWLLVGVVVMVVAGVLDGRRGR